MGCQPLLALLTLVYLSKLMSPHELGAYLYYWSVVLAIFSAVGMALHKLGISNALVSFEGSHPLNIDLTLLLLLFLPGIPLILILQYLFSINLIIGYSIISTHIIFLYLVGFLQGKKNIIFTKIIQSAFKPLIILILVFFHSKLINAGITWQIILIYQLFSIVLSLGILIAYCAWSELIYIKYKVTNYTACLLNFLRKIWSVATLMVSNLLRRVNENIVLWLMPLLLSLEEVSYFRIAVSFMLPMVFYTEVINTKLQVDLMEAVNARNVKRIRVLYNNAVLNNVIFSLPIYLILMISGETVIGYLFEARYINSNSYLYIIATFNMMSIFIGPSYLVLVCLKKYRYSAFVTCISIIASVLIFILLNMFSTEQSAGYAVGVSLVLMKLVCYIVIKRVIANDMA